MDGPQAYLNGKFVPAATAALPLYDSGFLHGTTVAEQLRTFGGRLFQLERHLERLAHSLAIVGVDPGIDARGLHDVAEELAVHNHRLLEAGDDLGMTIFVTPGPYAAVGAGAEKRPTVCLHTFPLAFHLWARKYRNGEHLATTDVAQVSERCWPRELKCRSRMHYYLADRQARERHSGARAIMRDDDGFVTEATTANVVIFQQGGGLATPPAAKVLPGISLAVLARLAADEGLSIEERDILPADVAEADEVLLTSTSPCVLPVVRFNGRAIGRGEPGPVHQRLLEAWGREVGVDVVQQAMRFSERQA